MKIQVKDEVIHLFSTHTQASYVGDQQRFSVMTRGDQFIVLREFIQQSLKKYHYKPGEVCLLLGDFNVDARSPFIETKKIDKHSCFKV